MAVLIDADRTKLWADLMTGLSARREPLAAINKNELRAAVNAVDDWIEANQASYNAALPEPAKTVLTARQKAELLVFVVRRRWEVS